MKYFLLVVLLSLSTSANAAIALWTGRSEIVRTVTLQMGVNCEYRYINTIFWVTFTGYQCPNTVQIQ